MIAAAAWPASSLAQGTGAATPMVSVEPMSLRFTQAAARTSRNQIVTVGNSGNLPLVLGKIRIDGPHAGEFAPEISSTCVSGLSVEPGRSCDLTINFTPCVAGARSAVLLIPHNGHGSPIRIQLNGTGTEADQQAAAGSTRDRQPGSAPL
jgi:hypothetical protein